MAFVLAAALLCSSKSFCAQGIAIRTDQLPWAIKGEPYQASVTARVSGRCPNGDVSLSVLEGELPRGVELFNYGLEGTPLRMGTFEFTLQARNGCGTAIRRLKLLVTGRPILLVSPRQVTFDQAAGESENQDIVKEDIVKVEASWPELPYSVITMSSAPWLTVIPSEGKTPDPESAFTGDRVRLRINTTGLAPGVYRTTLKFYAEGSENAPTVNVALRVHKAE